MRINQQKCSHCGHQFSREKVQCPSCKAWNMNSAEEAGASEDDTVLLSEVQDGTISRLKTGPWDYVFGGNEKTGFGIVDTSVALLGGGPGAGKSTLSLSIADSISGQSGRESLFIGAEQSEAELKLMAKRLKLKNMHLMRILKLGSQTPLQDVIEKYKAAAVIVDSLNALGVDDNEAVEMCKIFKEYAVQYHSPFIVISHVNKAGDFAGLEALQHQVDGTFSFFKQNDDDDLGIRELVTIKNRNGPSNRKAYFEMEETGLRHITPEELEELEEDDDDE